MGLLVLHQLPELLGILSHLGLDVHLLACGVLLLAADRVVVLELVREILLVLLVLIIVKQGLGVGHPHEEPGKALELAAAIGAGPCIIMEKEAAVRAHRGDSGACGQHDDVGLWILRQKHLGSRGSGDHHIVSDRHVANVVGADSAVDLVLRVGCACLVRLVLTHLAVCKLAIHFHDTLHAQGDGLGVLVVSHCRRGDGIQADPGRRLALLVRTWSNDSNGLSFNVRHLSTVIEGHVGRLPVGVARLLGQGLWVHVVLNHLPRVRCLWGEEVPWDLLAMDDLHALLLDSGSPPSGRGLRRPRQRSCCGKERSTRQRRGGTQRCSLGRGSSSQLCRSGGVRVRGARSQESTASKGTSANDRRGFGHVVERSERRR
mmetsp:Transcript_15387/g.29025  ORF Transcript_15387/g.29025 Transcript_15387/m.29025 type:complete len:374 (-) Transcript_15387:24-1145(-)